MNFVLPLCSRLLPAVAGTSGASACLSLPASCGLPAHWLATRSQLAGWPCVNYIASYPRRKSVATTKQGLSQSL